MPHLKFYKFIIAGLLLLNFVLLTFLFLGRPKHPRIHQQNRSRAFFHKAPDLLDLDTEQQVAFRKLARAHHNKMNHYDSAQVALLPSYFEQLKETELEEYSDEVLDKISSIERKKVEFTYQHFENVRKLLRPEQLKNYDDFVNKATKKIYNKRAQLNEHKKSKR